MSAGKFVLILVVALFYGSNALPVKLKRLHFVPVRFFEDRQSQLVNMMQRPQNGSSPTPRPPAPVRPRPPFDRIFWNALGDFIQSSSFFPIEVNVPDTVGSIYGGISGLAGSIAQRIPIVNRWTNPSQPRPLKYIILVPLPPATATLYDGISAEDSLAEVTENTQDHPIATPGDGKVKNFLQDLFTKRPEPVKVEEAPLQPAVVEVPFIPQDPEPPGNAQENLLRYLAVLQQHNYMLQQAQVAMQHSPRPEVPFQPTPMLAYPGYYGANRGGYGLFYPEAVVPNIRGQPNLVYNLDGTILQPNQHDGY